MEVQRGSSDPLYLQVKELLIGAIDDGLYQPHQQLPSERVLSTTFQVSRMTVRQALVDLVREGIIYARVGKGTFVAERKIDQELRMVTSFTHDVQARGGRPTSRVLEARISTPTPDVRAALRLPPDALVVLLARLRFADSEPLALETAFLPAALFPDLLQHDFTVASLYDVLERAYKLTLVQAEQTIEAALAMPHEVELLCIEPPAAVLKMQRLTQTTDGTMVEYVLSVYRGDRYKFHSMLHPGNGP